MRTMGGEACLEIERSQSATIYAKHKLQPKYVGDSFYYLELNPHWTISFIEL
jgi:hypothetical protein